jgi:Protein of unknown function (DUF1572)
MLSDIKQEFRRHQRLAEAALAELDDSCFFERPRPHVNPIALIVKHIAGNLHSRWTEFLTSDGEKPGRNRDNEFVLGDADTRQHIMAGWDRGWSALWDTLQTLTDSDLDRIVTIRGEPHTARQAVLRSLTHTAYHVGQILYLVRTLQPDSRWLTIAPGESRTHVGKYLA